MALSAADGTTGLHAAGHGPDDLGPATAALDDRGVYEQRLGARSMAARGSTRSGLAGVMLGREPSRGDGHPCTGPSGRAEEYRKIWANAFKRTGVILSVTLGVSCGPAVNPSRNLILGAAIGRINAGDATVSPTAHGFVIRLAGPPYAALTSGGPRASHQREVHVLDLRHLSASTREVHTPERATDARSRAAVEAYKRASPAHHRDLA
jgi:hypothetical protein